MINFPNKLIDHHRALAPLDEEGIRTLPMLYRADVGFALTKVSLLWDFISHLPVNPFDYKYQSLDVKVCMLKKGWYPCIPGWHCDDFYRPRGDGQPDVEALAYHNSRHFMCLYGDSSTTEFLSNPIELPSPDTRGAHTVYGFYNAEINRWLKQFQYPSAAGVVRILPQHLYEFDSRTFHRGMPAIKDGWRAFVRLTLGFERPPKNEIRTQVNVYVPADELEAGW